MRAFLAILFLTVSTVTAGQISVKVNPLKGPDQLLNLSEIASVLRYVKLETNDSCVVSTVDKVMTDDRYIFLTTPFKESRRLLIFTKEGKFVRMIGSVGRGPGEYLSLLDFSVNTATKELYILDSYGNILIYLYDGTHLKTLTLDSRPSKLFCLNSKLWLFSAWPDYYMNKGFAIQVFSLERSLPEKYMINRKWVDVKRNPNSLIYPNFHFSSLNSATVGFYEEKFDTLYYIDRQYNGIPAYVIDLNNDMPLYFATQSEFNQQIRKHNVLSDFIDTKNYLLFSVMAPNPATKYFFAVSKKTGQILKHNITKDKQRFINDIDYGPPFIPRGYASNNVLYSTIDSYKLKEFFDSCPKRPEYNPKQSNLKEIEGLVSKSDFSDNPVIILTKLK